MIKGSITALLTPFCDGALDEDALARFADWQVGQGSQGLVPCGTTGEAPVLGMEEFRRTVEITVEAVAGRVPVIAGCGANDTAKAVKLAEISRKAGADAVLVVAPYYNKPGPEGQFAHFRAVHDAADLPFILYNIPGRTAVDVTLATMQRMRKNLSNFAGLKDATGDLARVPEQRLALGKDFIQLSGEDATAVGFNAMGGQGCISVTANIAPALCAGMQKATLDGDYEKARDIQDRLMPLHEALFAETSPAPAKWAAEYLGLFPSRELRLPLVTVSKETQDRLARVLSGLGLEGPEG